MRPVEKRDIISCQLSLLPIGTEDYLEVIDQVLKKIKESGLDYNIGGMSSIVTGDSQAVFELLADINEAMSDSGFGYSMNIMISNVCGCVR